MEKKSSKESTQLGSGEQRVLPVMQVKVEKRMRQTGITRVRKIVAEKVEVVGDKYETYDPVYRYAGKLSNRMRKRPSKRLLKGRAGRQTV